MIRFRARLGRVVGSLVLALGVGAACPTQAHAQFFGGGLVGGGGFGWGSPGFAAGFPPGYINGGFPGFGGGYGFPGFGGGYGFSGYGYPGFGFGFPGYGYGYGAGFGASAFGFPTYGAYGNPLLSLGLTPLAVQSALGEKSLRGATGTVYGFPRYPSAVQAMPQLRIIRIPASQLVTPPTPSPGAGSGATQGAGSGATQGAGSGATQGAGSSATQGAGSGATQGTAKPR